MNYLVLIALVICMVPVMAIIDYCLLRDHVAKCTGKEPGVWFWSIPCVVEVGCFVIGVLVGNAGAVC